MGRFTRFARSSSSFTVHILTNVDSWEAMCRTRLRNGINVSTFVFEDLALCKLCATSAVYEKVLILADPIAEQE